MEIRFHDGQLADVLMLTTRLVLLQVSKKISVLLGMICIVYVTERMHPRQRHSTCQVIHCGGVSQVSSCLFVSLSSSFSSGHYLYIYKWNGNHNQPAVLRSAIYRQPKTSFCQLTFWYYMYGPWTRLEVDLHNDGRQRTIFHKNGNQSDVWRLASINIGVISSPTFYVCL